MTFREHGYKVTLWWDCSLSSASHGKDHAPGAGESPLPKNPPALSIRSKRTTTCHNPEAVLPQALPTLSVFSLLQLSPTCNLDRHFHENCSPLGVDRILAILNQIHEGYLDFSVSPAFKCQ